MELHNDGRYGVLFAKLFVQDQPPSQGSDRQAEHEVRGSALLHPEVGLTDRQGNPEVNHGEEELQ